MAPSPAAAGEGRGEGTTSNGASHPHPSPLPPAGERMLRSRRCSVKEGRVVALAGGVGGSKLAFGLYHQLGERLTVVVNTGDDETMYGLRVCPDLDTVRYTLSGMANAATG